MAVPTARLPPAARALLGAAAIAPMPVLVILAHAAPVPTVVCRCGFALPVLGAVPRY